MRNLLLGATLLAAVGASPAMAANTAIILWNAADPAGFESATGTDIAALNSTSLDGVTTTLSFVSRNTAPNGITEGNINIQNTTNSVQTLKIIAGANGFLGNDAAFQLTGTIGATLGLSDLAGQFFADQLNVLNGVNETVVGNQIGAFNSGSLTGPQSFSFNGLGFDNLTSPYGLAEELTLTLQPHASVFVQGLSMEATSAIPEPRTWALMALGFGLMAMMGVKKARKGRLEGALT